jgi:SNF2 family DNA or RNA helicase
MLPTITILPHPDGYRVSYPAPDFSAELVAALRSVRAAVGREHFQFDGLAWTFRDPVIVLPALARALPQVDSSRVTVTPVGTVAGHPALGALGRMGLLRPLYPTQEGSLCRVHDLGGNCILCIAMGGGKTAVAIAYGEITPGRKIVVSPKSVQRQWADELNAMTGKTATIVRGTKKQREALLREGGEYTILTYEQARDTREALWALDCALAIFDEAQYLKNPQAKRTIACLGYRDDLTLAEQEEKRAATPGFRGRKTWRGGVRSPRKLMLSGTPLMNRPIELWPLLNAIDPVTWGNEWAFKERYCDMTAIEVPRMELVAPVVQRLAPQLAGTPYAALPREIQAQVPRRTAKRMQGASNLDELHLRIQPHYHRVKLREIVTDMPELTRLDTAVELTAAQRSDYEDALLRFDDWLREQGKSEDEVARAMRAQALAKMNALRQRVLKAKTEQLFAALDTIVEGWGMSWDEEGRQWQYDAAQVDEERESVLVFSTYTAPLGAIVARYGALCGTIVGADSSAARDATRTAFQAGRFPILLLTHAAGGVGLNLQRARLVFMLNEDWTPAANEQAIARAYRNGQKRGVTVYTLLVTDSVDAEIHEALALKAEIIAQVLDGTASEIVSEQRVLTRVLVSLRRQAAAARQRTQGTQNTCSR